MEKCKRRNIRLRGSQRADLSNGERDMIAERDDTPCAVLGTDVADGSGPKRGSASGHLGGLRGSSRSVHHSPFFAPVGLAVSAFNFTLHDLSTNPRSSTVSLNSFSWFEHAHCIVINIYISSVYCIGPS